MTFDAHRATAGPDVGDRHSGRQLEHFGQFRHFELGLCPLLGDLIGVGLLGLNERDEEEGRNDRQKSLHDSAYDAAEGDSVGCQARVAPLDSNLSATWAAFRNH